MGCRSVACGSVVYGSVACGYIDYGYMVYGSGVIFSKGPISVFLGNGVVVWILNGCYSWNGVVRTVGSCNTL